MEKTRSTNSLLKHFSRHKPSLYSFRYNKRKKRFVSRVPLH